MKPLFKILSISVTSAVIGGVIVFGAFKYSPSLRLKVNEEKPSRDAVFDDILKRQEGIQHKFDSLFDEDFFNQNDPFEEMKKMRQRMEKRMANIGPHHRSMSNPFDSWFSNKFGGGTVNDISRREDNEFVYYDIQLGDLNETSINTKIENGYITISGSLEKKVHSSEEDNSAQGIFKSTFNRTFPLPEHVDQDKMQMIPEKDKVVLKFPKLKSYGTGIENKKNLPGHLTI